MTTFQDGNIRIRADLYNDTPEWWSALRDSDLSDLAEHLDEHGEAFVNDDGAELPLLKALPGWDTGPEYAPNPLLVEKAPVLVYKFKVHRFTEGLEHAEASLAAGREYYNTLIDLHRESRLNYRRLQNSFGGICDLNDAIAELKRQIAELDQEIRTKNSGHKPVKGEKRKKPDLTAERARKKALTEEKRELLVKLRPLSAEFKAKLKEHSSRFGSEFDAIKPTNRKEWGDTKLELLKGLSSDWPEWTQYKRTELDIAQRQRQARSDSGLSHGVYGAVERAASAAGFKSQDPNAIREKRDRDEDGILGSAQIKDGTTVADMFAGRSANCSMVPVDHAGATKRLRHGDTDAPVTMRLDAKRVLRFVIRQSRDLPKDALVRAVQLSFRKTGFNRALGKPKYDVHILFTLRMPFKKPARSGLVAAINFGWRALPENRYRVAYLVDSAGRCREIALPRRLRDKLEFAQSLKGVQDSLAHQARVEMSRLEKAGLFSDELKQAIADILVKQDADATKYSIARVRAPGKTSRLAGVFIRDQNIDTNKHWAEWKAMRLANREDLFAPIEEVGSWLAGQDVTNELYQAAVWLDFWRRKNAHLWQMAEANRSKVMRWRTQVYWTLAGDLEGLYDLVLTNKVSFSALARTRGTETPIQKAGAAHRFQVSPSDLRERIAKRSPLHQIEVPSITEHHGCGGTLIDESAGASINLRCEKCDGTVDQDANACRQILAIHQEKASA